MTLKGGIGSDWHRQTEISSLLAPRPAFLDSSLRWNDDGVWVWLSWILANLP